MFAGNSSILRSRNSVSTQPARIEPFTHSSGGDFADLSDLSSRKDCPHLRALQLHILPLHSRRSASKGSPRCRWLAVHAVKSMSFPPDINPGTLRVRVYYSLVLPHSRSTKLSNTPTLIKQDHVTLCVGSHSSFFTPPCSRESQKRNRKMFQSELCTIPHCST